MADYNAYANFRVLIANGINKQQFQTLSPNNEGIISIDLKEGQMSLTPNMFVEVLEEYRKADLDLAVSILLHQYKEAQEEPKQQPVKQATEEGGYA